MSALLKKTPPVIGSKGLRIPVLTVGQLVGIGVLLLIPMSAIHGATPLSRVDLIAQEVKKHNERLGESQAEVYYQLAWVYAKHNQGDRAIHYVKLARKKGVSNYRIDLLLGMLFRQQGRFDAAFNTLVRVLVRQSDQPFALIQLWKALYEAKLQGVEIRSDTSEIVERLSKVGMHFPIVFDPQNLSLNKSKEIAATGYNALLSGKNTFAAELFEAAIDAFPSNPIAHRGLAIARARGQDLSRAVGAYFLYLELNPLAPDADEIDANLIRYWKNMDN